MNSIIFNSCKFKLNSGQTIDSVVDYLINNGYSEDEVYMYGRALGFSKDIISDCLNTVLKNI